MSKKTITNQHEKTSKRQKQRHWYDNARLQAIVLAALAALLYVQTVPYEYVLDDRIFITEHQAVQRGIAGIPELLTKHSMYSSSLNINQGRYRPLTFISFALEQQFVPNKPVVGHVVNIALYAATAALLLVVLRRLLKNYHPLLPLAAALLFVVHPIHTEVVANIKSRDLLLSLLFSLLALRSLLRYHQPEAEQKTGVGDLVKGAVFTALALLSQEGAVTFLAVLPLSVYFFTSASLKKNILSCLPFVAAAMLVLGIRAVVVGQTDDSWMKLIVNYLYVNASPMDALATKTAIMGRYLLMLVFPITMAHDYGYKQLEIVSWANWQAIASLAAHAVLIGIALWKLREKHIISYCILFYLATMAVASNFFLFYGMAMSDRMLYTPSVAGMIAFVWIAFKALGFIPNASTNTPEQKRRSFSTVPPALYAVLGIVVVLYAGRTIARNPAWQSDFTLNKAGAESGAERSLGIKTEYARMCLAVAAQDPNPAASPYLATAYRELHECLALDPNGMSTTHIILGQYFSTVKIRYDSAIYYYQRAAELDPTFLPIRFNLALVRADSALRTQHYDRAQMVLQEALSYNIRLDIINVKLGVTFYMKAEYPKAVEYFKLAQRINPESIDAQKGLEYCAQKMKVSEK